MLDHVESKYHRYDTAENCNLRLRRMVTMEDALDRKGEDDVK